MKISLPDKIQKLNFGSRNINNLPGCQKSIIMGIVQRLVYHITDYHGRISCMI